MTKVIAGLLSEADAELTHLINRLETLTGLPGEDIKLTSDIATKVRMVKRQLDLLDYAVPAQVYKAMQHTLALHDSFLAKKLNVTKASEAPQQIQYLIARLKVNKNVWVLRQSVAKRLVMKSPPKKLMKHLKHRSVESMLKHENICELFVGMHYLESDKWLQAFAKGFRNLGPSDFESRDVKVMALDNNKWSNLMKLRSQKRHSILAVSELGIIAISPLPDRHLSGITLTIFTIVIGYINEIRSNSASIKLHQMSAGFGRKLDDVLNGVPLVMASLAEQDIDWQMLFNHFGRIDLVSSSIFDPHLQNEDFEPINVEEVLYHLEPALKFWHGLEYVGITDKTGPVSFNLLDNCLNYLNELPFAKRTYRHMQASLYDELLLRYLAKPTIQQMVNEQIERTLVKSSLITRVGD